MRLITMTQPSLSEAPALVQYDDNDANDERIPTPYNMIVKDEQ